MSREFRRPPGFGPVPTHDEVETARDRFVFPSASSVEPVPDRAKPIAEAQPRRGPASIAPDPVPPARVPTELSPEALSQLEARIVRRIAGRLWFHSFFTIFVLGGLACGLFALVMLVGVR